MAFVKKVVACKCGKNFNFEFSSDMEVEDVTISSKCTACGNGIFIAISNMGNSNPVPLVPQPQAPFDISLQSDLSSVSSPSVSSDSPVHDWDIAELEHAAPVQSISENIHNASENPQADATKTISLGSKTAINDAMNDLFKEE